ncbi:membrane-anchored ubiquitin-fold protein 6 isoform X1 [Syzygium oleosum]|uniref:membrane-anchored ubiquitin-fold protein 6 isoform X1 n=2 Tax=Syzygium oleosum TaxID=219896 RepID=UPI0024BB3C1B|nr:membrane-anchored ubiquitin-fold protein 6 isoform X1 [Syzygium oleosum]
MRVSFFFLFDEMDGEGSIEIKFRLADGSDIGPSRYSPAMTVASLKEKVVAHWPRDKENGPKTLNDVKLIHAGKILENNKTLAESRLQVGELPGGVITMHVVVRPPNPDKKNEKLQNESMGKTGCSCSIL